MIRFLHIISVLLRYAVIYFLVKLKLYRKEKHKILRNFFEDAGGSFVKFGQILALRVDFLPTEYSLELLNLLDNIKSFSYKDVEITFIQELGAIPDKIFKDFQKDPFASASFGQVHAAKLEDDTILAVKVMRPGIEEDIVIDFFFIDILAFFGDIFFRVKALPWKEFAQEYKKWTLNELDYRVEAMQAEKFHSRMQGVKNIVIPKTFHRFSTRRILTQEYIEGIPLSRALRGLRDGRITQDDFKDMGIDIVKTPKILVREIMRQYFFLGFFHADPHPGNILLLPNDRIGIVDFGIIGESSAQNNRSFLRALKAFGNMDFANATYYFADFSGEKMKRLIDSALPASLEQKRIDDFMHIIADHFSKTVEKIIIGNIKDLKEMKKDYTAVLLELFKAAESFELQLPQESSILFRALTVISLFSKEIDYDFQLTVETKKFFEEYTEDMIIKQETNIPYKRINRERALEQLNNWLAYLFEKDPKLFHLVNNFVQKYNIVNKK